ncbi:hypothetical protein GCM10027053_14120 [Intrasporangium mesophilum]
MARFAYLAVAWAAVPVLSRVSLFEIDPSSSDYIRPLEQLGALALCLPVAVCSIVLSDASAWALHASRRRPPWLRSSWLLFVTASSAMFGVLPVLLLPSGVPAAHVWWLWLLLHSVGALSVVMFDESVCGLVAMAVVVLATLPGVIPFTYNVVYNPEAEGILRAVTVAAALAAALSYAKLGDATGRREHPIAT